MAAIPEFAEPTDTLGNLARKPVSDLKREGWRGVMRQVGTMGQLLMTNHEQPEAVILSLAAYRQLTEQAGRAAREDEQRLQRLSQAFDDELAALRQPDAAERLREAFGKPLRLREANEKPLRKRGKQLAGRF